MTSDILYNLIFKASGDAKIQAMVEKMHATVDKTEAAINSVGKSLKKLNSISLDATLNNINRVASGFQSVAKPGLNLSTNMYDLQAITGVAGSKLKEIEGYARKSAKTFGGDASQAVESYKLILSQLTPEIAKQPKALQAMGNSVSTASKLMGNNAVAATELLTTAMNQYQVSTDDPIQASKTMASMMNVMAAGAKEGSAELPQIKQALENAGMAAKGANVSFEETNAAIQVLDKAGKKGAEGGIALRNALSIMGQGRFLPKDTQTALKAAGVDIAAMGNNSLPLSARLKALTPVLNDGALLSKLFGMENQNAARALISGIPEVERMTKAITGTNTAYEQAATVMQSPEEKNKRLQAQVDDFKISLFNATGGLMGYMGVIGDTTKTVTDLWPALQFGGKVLGTLTSTTKMYELGMKAGSIAASLMSGAQAILNTIMSMNPIALIVIAIAAMVAIVTVCINKWDEWGAGLLMLLGPIGWVVNAVMSIKEHWDSIVNAFKSDGIIGGIKRIGMVLLDVVLKPTQQLLELLAKIPGMGKYINPAIDSIKAYREKNDLLSQGEKDKNNAQTGIAAPAQPGAVATGTGKTGKQAVATKNEAIVTGGTKNTIVHVHIGKQVETLKIEAANITEGAKKMRDIIVDELTRAVAMGAALGGNS